MNSELFEVRQTQGVTQYIPSVRNTDPTEPSPPEELDYPTKLNYKKKGTSSEAAAQMAVEAPTLRQKCLREVARCPHTTDAVAEILGESVLSIRPRFSELAALGLIVATGEVRKNRSGRMATVWKTK